MEKEIALNAIREHKIAMFNLPRPSDAYMRQ